MPAIERASLQLNYSSDLHLIPRGAQHETRLNQSPRGGYNSHRPEAPKPEKLVQLGAHTDASGTALRLVRTSLYRRLNLHKPPTKTTFDAEIAVGHSVANR